MLQFVQHMHGRPYHYTDANLHLISTEAYDAIAAGLNRSEVLANVNAMRPTFHEHAAFVIEVSTSAEHMVGPLAIGTFLSTGWERMRDAASIH
jgi:hypothetical protein